jgi:hypothetical protein
MDSTQPDGAAANASDSADIRPLIQSLAGAGCALIALYALRFQATGDGLRIFGVAVLVAAAALAAGVLTGFIFAIPREGAPKKDGDKSAATAASGAAANPITSNTNLVEISDWLTKIIVGVGLVELKSLPIWLGGLAYTVGRSLQPAQCGSGASCTDLILSGQSVAMAIMIFYCALGFLWGYIWMRLSFQRDLEERNRKLEQEVSNKQQERKAIDWIVAAEGYIGKDELDDAMNCIEEALSLHSDDGWAMLTKGRILKRQATRQGVAETRKVALLSQALDCARRAIDLMPQEAKAEPTYNKACYQALLGFDDQQILSTLEAAFRLKPALRQVAPTDNDLERVWENADFKHLTEENPPRNP